MPGVRLHGTSATIAAHTYACVWYVWYALATPHRLTLGWQSVSENSGDALRPEAPAALLRGTLRLPLDSPLVLPAPIETDICAPVALPRAGTGQVRGAGRSHSHTRAGRPSAHNALIMLSYIILYPGILDRGTWIGARSYLYNRTSFICSVALTLMTAAKAEKTILS